MASNKKKSEKGLTDAEKERARAQMAKQREKAAKKRERDKAKAAKDAEAYEKAAAAERKRVAEERAKLEAQENDPAYQAKKAAEEERLKEKGRKELEKSKKKQAKKAEAAARSKEKIAAKEKSAQLEMKPSRAGAYKGAAAGVGSAAGGTAVKRRKRNIIALVAIVVIAIVAAIILYPPQKTITQGLDIQGGVSVNLRATTTDGSTPSSEQMDEAQKVITSRVNASGASAASVQKQGADSFLVQVPGAEDSQAIIDTLSSQGVLEFVRLDSVEDEDTRSLIDSGITGMNLKDEGIGYTAFMTGESVSNVTVSHPEGSADYAVNLDLDSEGTAQFADVTSELVSTNGKIAIVLDGRVECAPAVQSAITTGDVQITGNYTIDEANSLKAIINSGSLPVTLSIDQSSIVGPTLGQGALWVGIVSAGIGLILVIIWLLLFYNGLGLLTGVSVLVMGVIYMGLLALLSRFGWFSLTLPGIAGIIVNIGLSADSSILIMECFHEQVRRGRSIKSAAFAGVREGILTSLDADVVTLVSALVLYFVAIGDVRGFGLTLALGIICDLVVMALFSGPVIRLLGQRSVEKHSGFWGMRDEVNEGKYISGEVM